MKLYINDEWLKRMAEKEQDANFAVGPNTKLPERSGIKITDDGIYIHLKFKASRLRVVSKLLGEAAQLAAALIRYIKIG